MSFTSQLTLDQNLDGISDGISLAGSAPRFGLSSSMGTQDLDSDGILNTQDPDVDGDGVVNVFDTDDDNDGILDVFDVDSDGDLVEDHILESSDQYFSSGIEWFTVMYNNDEALNKKTLTILAKLRDGANPASVQISGPASLLDSAMVEYVDEDGNPVSQAFNGVLLDEGNDNDGSEEIYSTDSNFGLLKSGSNKFCALPTTCLWLDYESVLCRVPLFIFIGGTRKY